ncbi:MAG: diguanylate cyclase [Nitrospina sp.]|nr:diguanylate cyclase [Nitrospina sp.]
MKKSLDILVIDDDEVDRMNVQHLLDKEGLKAKVHEAADYFSGKEKIKSHKFDCVLIDYKLPDATGLEILENLKQADRYNVPMILLTGMGGEQLVAEVMKKGAADYLSKNGLNGKHLVKSIKNAIQVGSFEQKVRAAEYALAESEKSYRTIVETVSDVIFRLGLDQKIEFINPAIRFFGYEPQDLVGQSIDTFIDLDPNDQEIISKIATREVGPMSTCNLEVNLKFARESVLGEKAKPIPVLLDAFGLWDVSQEQVFRNHVEKNFQGTLCIARNIMEIKAVEKELLMTQNRLMDAVENLKKLSTMDGLTEIANRRYFDEYSDKEWKRAQRDQNPFSVVMIDLDSFKSYNDTYGHQQGDVCLKKVADVLKGAMKRPADLAARYGGEEFVLILPDTDAEGALNLAKKLRKDVEGLKLEHINNVGEKWVTVSLGVATDVVKKGNSFADLLSKADKALYQAKESGRNQVSLFKEG